MTKKPNPSPFVRHIQDLYEMETADEMRETLQRTVTLNFPVEDACMLAAIAKRFGSSTAAFGGELFAQHVRELFLALTPDDRRALASEADAEVTRYAESKGVTISSNAGPGSTHWQMHADICDRVEGADHE